ncbi:MAG: hypothetical protein J6P81_00380 [Spirochaetales bacterium]|nr:hypothetical protein [Spirochaetales bacterium]MBO6049090.1 hypothetical protein [Spirochaetales bacterium]MBO7349467.1 hypothetical protein [Spirochaetales bacterium]MBP5757647.1 hypothetical protein [Spirochaetales bacterium]
MIKSHTVRGGEILKSFKSLEHVEDGARYHHERYDGRGYPEGKERFKTESPANRFFPLKQGSPGTSSSS